MRDTQTKTFKTTQGAVPVSVVQLPAIRSAKLLIKLLDTVGPGLAALAQVVKPGAAQAMDLGALPDGVAKLFERLDGDKFEALLSELLIEAQVQLKGERLDLNESQLNTLFRGNVLELLKLFVFAVQVNYADFFGGLDGFARLAEKMKRAIPTHSNSEGSNTSSGQPND